MRSAAERGASAAGAGAGALVGPLLQNLVLSSGDNEELCYCLKAWQALPASLRRGGYPSKEDALKVGLQRPLRAPGAACIMSCGAALVAWIAARVRSREDLIVHKWRAWRTPCCSAGHVRHLSCWQELPRGCSASELHVVSKSPAKHMLVQHA